MSSHHAIASCHRIMPSHHAIASCHRIMASHHDSMPLLHIISSRCFFTSSLLIISSHHLLKSYFTSRLHITFSHHFFRAFLQHLWETLYVRWGSPAMSALKGRLTIFAIYCHLLPYTAIYYHLLPYMPSMGGPVHSEGVTNHVRVGGAAYHLLPSIFTIYQHILLFTAIYHHILPSITIYCHLLPYMPYTAIYGRPCTFGGGHQPCPRWRGGLPSIAI
jgi:hypothetical protein